MRAPLRWLAALALVAGTGLAACGDDDEVDTDPATPSDSSEEEMTEDEEMTDDTSEDDMSDEG